MRVKQIIAKYALYIASCLGSLGLSYRTLAQAYGEGAYGQCSYQTCNFHLGPISLPATGATIYGALSILLFVSGVVWLVILRKKRKSSSSKL